MVRFKKPEEILAEAAALVAAGHKEIVLTGVHIGSYGQTTARRRRWATPENPHLPALLDQVAQVPGLSRIRLSSLDPADVTTALLDTFCKHPNLMPHLHLSLQSGSDNVLRRMARPYTADEFRAKVALIRNRLDRPALTTDIIVGFPGETDADFDQTVTLAKEVAFAKMHIFVFSARKGTAAAKMQPKVPSEVKKARSQVLRDLDQTLQSQFRSQFLGETAQVLIETTNGHPTGRAERYFEVQVVDRSHSSGDIVAAKLEEMLPTASWRPRLALDSAACGFVVCPQGHPEERLAASPERPPQTRRWPYDLSYSPVSSGVAVRVGDPMQGCENG